MDPTQVTQYQTGFAPEIAPYAQNLLGQTYATVFQPAKDASGKVIMDETSGLPQVGGFQPFQTYDTQDRFAQFTPLQQQSFTGAQGMAPSQYTQGAANMAGIAGLGALGTKYGSFNPATSGFNQGQTAANYMSPYTQNVVDIQQREAKRQSNIAGTQQQGQATQAGAFGGGRDAIMRAERERNLGTQLGDIQAKGLQDAYTQAMQQFNTENQLGEQSKQFGAGLGLQGLQTALQGANTMGALGQQNFQQGMDINKLQNQYGGQQQQQMQNMLNADYQQFLDKQNYPYKQLGFMSDMVRGLPISKAGETMYQQPASALGQIAGLAQGFGSMMGGKKDGGQIRAYAEGGSITNPSDGKLASMMDGMSDQQLQQIAKLSPMPQARRLAQEELQDRAAMRMRSGGIVAFKEGGNEGEETTSRAGQFFNEVMSDSPDAIARRRVFENLKQKNEAMMQANRDRPGLFEQTTPKKIADTEAKSIQAAKDYLAASRTDSSGKGTTLPSTGTGGGRGTVNPPAPSSSASASKDDAGKSTGSGKGVVAAAANLAQSQGISKDDFMDNVKDIMKYLGESSSKELDGLKAMIAQNAGKADEVRSDAQRRAMMNFGFNMAAEASKRGTGSGIAGALRAASAASPSIGASMDESSKLAQQMEDNQRQLQIEMAKYSVSMRKGDERTAIGLASNIRQLQQQQQDLAERARHNRATEGLHAASQSAAGKKYDYMNNALSVKKGQLAMQAQKAGADKAARELKDPMVALEHKKNGVTFESLSKKYANEMYGATLAGMTSGLTPDDSED